MTGQNYQAPPPPQYPPPAAPPPMYGPRFEHADIIHRFVALIIDGILIAVVSNILAWILLPIMGIGWWDWGGIVYFLLYLPIVWLYFGLTEGGLLGFNATLGKHLMSLKVVNTQYQPIDMGTGLIRNLTKALWSFWGILFILDVILLLVGDQTQQTLGDKLANTYVVTERARAPQPYYPPPQQYQQPPQYQQAPPPQQGDYPPPPPPSQGY